jgi:hypothetical protein
MSTLKIRKVGDLCGKSKHQEADMDGKSTKQKACRLDDSKDLVAGGMYGKSNY